MKKLEKEKSAALRSKNFDKASEIQSQIDDLEEKAKNSRPKTWQYEGKISSILIGDQIEGQIGIEVLVGLVLFSINFFIIKNAKK